MKNLLSCPKLFIKNRFFIFLGQIDNILVVMLDLECKNRIFMDKLILNPNISQLFKETNDIKVVLNLFGTLIV
jgi:hypothetical protein